MKLNKLKTSLGLALALAWAAAPAQAELLYSFQDDDIDFVLGADGAVKTSGAITVGDTFVSVFEIPVFTIGGSNGIPAGQELTGVAAVELKAIIGGGGVGTQYIFGSSNYLNTTLGTGAGSAIAMYFNETNGAGGDIDLELDRSVNPASNCVSLADCVAQGSMGDLYQVDGFLGDPDEFWAATQILAGGGDLGTVLGTNNSILISAFNIGLSNLFQDGGTVGFINLADGTYCGTPGYVADGCVQVSGSGTLTGGQGLVNGAVAHSDFDAQKYVIPEPASLALLGIGLVGLGVMQRRRS